jgi:hypothetical protein
MKKSFNLSLVRTAQMMPPPAAPAPAPMQDGAGAVTAPMDNMDPTGQQQAPAKYTEGSLLDALNGDPSTTMDMLKNQLPGATVEVDQSNVPVESLLEPDKWMSLDGAKRGQIAGAIFNVLPQNMKDDAMTDDGNVAAKMEKVDLKASVEASNAAIKKLAESFVGQKVSFNLSKQAQSRVGMDTVVFGPDTATILPSVQQVGNLWHLVERNKGWGKKLDDMFGIDYEMVWRKNIMDKFYREYRDTDGNWTGGYLRKRFEIDSNIPEFNNMYLKPGDVRKPARATLTEGNLEESRGGKAFNWMKANSTSTVKTAESEPKKKVVAYQAPNLPDPLGGGAAKTGPQPWRCSCNKINEGMTGLCAKCGAPKSQGKMLQHHNRPYQKGETPQDMFTAPNAVQRGPMGNQFVNASVVDSLNKSANVPKDDDKDDDDEELEEIDDLKEPVEFKQLRSTAVASDTVRAHHKRRERTFNALCGSPDNNLTGPFKR